MHTRRPWLLPASDLCKVCKQQGGGAESHMRMCAWVVPKLKIHFADAAISCIRYPYPLACTCSTVHEQLRYTRVGHCIFKIQKYCPKRTMTTNIKFIKL